MTTLKRSLQIILLFELLAFLLFLHKTCNQSPIFIFEDSENNDQDLPNMNLVQLSLLVY